MFKLKNKQVRTIISVIIFLLLSIFGTISLDETKDNTTDYKLTDTSIFEVVDVVDGDTFKFLNENEVVTARLVGIDTPEKNHPQKDVECFAIEASKELERLILGNKVYLEFDSEQGETDRYGRLLVHVWLDDRNGIFINKYLVENGYARAYRSSLSTYLEEIIKLESIAKDDNRGLWGDVCQETVVQ
jgi:micrococcal nuclease